MYTMIPFNRRNVLNRASELFDDRFFRSFFNMNDWMGSAGFRVDIRENADNYVLEAELPGVSEDRISLSCENDTLTLGGHAFTSRFILGSGKYSPSLIEAAVQHAGAQMITLSVLRNGIIVQTATDIGDDCRAACDVVF